MPVLTVGEFLYFDSLLHPLISSCLVYFLNYYEHLPNIWEFGLGVEEKSTEGAQNRRHAAATCRLRLVVLVVKNHSLYFSCLIDIIFQNFRIMRELMMLKECFLNGLFNTGNCKLMQCYHKKWQTGPDK